MVNIVFIGSDQILSKSFYAGRGVSKSFDFFLLTQTLQGTVLYVCGSLTCPHMDLSPTVLAELSNQGGGRLEDFQARNLELMSRTLKYFRQKYRLTQQLDFDSFFGHGIVNTCQPICKTII